MIMLRRVRFKPKAAPPPRPARQYEGAWPTPRMTAKPIADLSSSVVVPIVKPPPVKPGKRPPTVEEKRWMDSIVTWGCIACRMDGRGVVPPAVHHILRGGRRAGHLYTLPLCPDHHQDSGKPGFIARHPHKSRFEKRYGAEMFLLEVLRINIDLGGPNG